jgi:hypothetical protein
MTEFGTSADQGQGLIYEGLLPLQWQESGVEASPLEIAKLDAKNEDVLRFIEVLDEYPSESVVEHTAINQELARVDVKFDLLLNLVTQLLGVYFPLPRPLRTRLTPDGVQWFSDEPINPGSNGTVEIYLSNRCPRPLVFHGRVGNVEQEGQGYRIAFQFGELSEAIRERLEKLIFRQHRRSVALARRRVIDDPNTPS